jgi:hypothetical protein
MEIYKVNSRMMWIGASLSTTLWHHRLRMTWEAMELRWLSMGISLQPRRRMEKRKSSLLLYA